METIMENAHQTSWGDPHHAPKDKVLIILHWQNAEVTDTAVWLDSFQAFVTTRNQKVKMENLRGWIILPTQSLPLHRCNDGDYECFTDSDGDMFFKTFNRSGEVTLIAVKICPFCGKNAQNEDPEKPNVSLFDDPNFANWINGDLCGKYKGDLEKQLGKLTLNVMRKTWPKKEGDEVLPSAWDNQGLRED